MVQNLALKSLSYLYRVHLFLASEILKLEARTEALVRAIAIADWRKNENTLSLRHQVVSARPPAQLVSSPTKENQIFYASDQLKHSYRQAEVPFTITDSRHCSKCYQCHAAGQ